MAITSLQLREWDDAIFVSIAPKLDQDGNQRSDYDGNAQFIVNLGIFQDKRGRVVQEGADVTITVGPDGKTGLENVRRGTPVRTENLTARPWNMDSGSGIAFAADKIVPLAASAAAPVAKAG